MTKTHFRNFSLFALLAITATMSFTTIPQSFATIQSIENCTAVGGCEITITPPDPVARNPDDGKLLVWDEVQNFVLLEDLKVDRVADPTASFIEVDPNGGYLIKSGTTVSSHYVQWDNLPRVSGHVTATLVFDSEIFAFITADQKMFDSDAQLGLPGLDYNDFFLRGLEFGDKTTMRGNEVDIDWFAGSPGDWTRLITAFSPSASVIEVEVDIKPGSDPSSVNCKNTKGNVTVAVFGSEDFDVASIDLESLQLNGIAVTEIHEKIHFEDKNDDGIDDAVLHLDKAGVCEATQDADLKESVDAVLSGSTTNDPSLDFEGTGDIRIVKR